MTRETFLSSRSGCIGGKTSQAPGLTMTTAFNVFARTMVRQQRIPFDVALDIPNETTVAAMKEAERLLEDRKK